MTLLKSELLHDFSECVWTRHTNDSSTFRVDRVEALLAWHTVRSTCVKDVVIDGLQWPYMCKVDSTWQDYGGPTIVGAKATYVRHS